MSRREMPTRRPSSLPVMSRVPAGIFSSRCVRATPLGPGRTAVPSGTSSAQPFQKANAMKITSIRPWLVKSDASYWGEFLFVEVTTDEGVSGWGEITTTTRLANRALCTILRQVGVAVTGEDPARIEHLWHKIFRSFTYMGSRGAAVECLSGIDIALWDIRGKVLGQPIYELLGGAVRDEVALYTHPDQSKFTSKEGVVREIRDIVKSGHKALKFDPYPYQRGGDEQRNGYLDGMMTRADEKKAA